MQLPPPPPVPLEDRAAAPAPPVRPPFVAIAAMLVWFGAAMVAYRGLWPYPPRHARDILVVGGVVWAAVVLGLLTVAQERVRGLAAALVVLGALGPLTMARWMPGVTQPPEHVIPGRPTLAVSAAPDGTFDLYVLPNGDASHLVELTDTASPDELWAHLSPDGTQIEYGQRLPDGSASVWVARVGAGWTVLSRSELLGDRRAIPEGWTPDGTPLVRLGSGHRPVIASVDAAGHASIELRDAENVAYAPDRRHVAFARTTKNGGWAIWVANADGSHAHVVADTRGDDDFPFWSPDGRTIAFTSTVTGSQDVWTVPASGGAAQNVTRGTPSSDDETWFGWTPEGQILFLSDRSGTGGRFLYFMDADGSDVRLALRI